MPEKRKTSLTLDADALDGARRLGVNVSAVSNAAIRNAVKEAERQAWLEENAEAFAAEAEWIERNGHPLAEIMVGPNAASWKD